MTRSTYLLALLCLGAVHTLDAQTHSVVRRYDLSEQRASLRETLVHNGKWVTAAGVVAFSVVAATEHRLSQRDWDRLLTICRSAQDACQKGADGRYLRSDAEALYQRSRAYDRRANRWLVGAQLSLIATTALFIIDLHPGEGPENIPFPASLQVGAVGSGSGIALSFRF